MNINDYHVLKDLLKELSSDLEELNRELQYNRRCIREAEVYAKSFMSSEPEDYRYFSPRDAETVHGEEIRRTYSDKLRYEKACQSLEQKREVLLHRISNLESIVEHEDCDLGFLKIQEEERQRIARDLHDTSLQNLTHLIHKTELSSLYIEKDPVQAKLELSLINKVLRETIDEIRNTIYDLRPMIFDDLGFKAAVERLLDSINDRKQYEMKVSVEETSCENNLVLASVYRMIKECLNNIVKYAECSEIELSCKMKNGICVVVVKDNGKGFDVENYDREKHFGLSLMKERIELLWGKLQITSKPGEGTEVLIEIPFYIYNK